MKLHVSIKKISRKGGAVGAVEYEYPDTLHTVRGLLEETVRIGVEDYCARMGSGQDVLRVLSKEEIDRGAAVGKIGFGVSYGEKQPVLEESVRNAVECFEDGIGAVVYNGEQMESLDGEVAFAPGGEVAFVRLVPLAGRMW